MCEGATGNSGSWYGRTFVLVGFLIAIGMVVVAVIAAPEYRMDWQTGHPTRMVTFVWKGQLRSLSLASSRFEIWSRLGVFPQPPADAVDLKFTDPGPYPSRWSPSRSVLGLAHWRRDYFEYQPGRWTGAILISMRLDRLAAVMWSLLALCFFFRRFRANAVWWPDLAFRCLDAIRHRPVRRGFHVITTPREDGSHL